MTSVSGAISQAGFAQRRGVSLQRVREWLIEKKIGGAALIVDLSGDLLIDEAAACAQLGEILDPNQRAL
jgi:hypothetical protein